MEMIKSTGFVSLRHPKIQPHLSPIQMSTTHYRNVGSSDYFNRLKPISPLFGANNKALPKFSESVYQLSLLRHQIAGVIIAWHKEWESRYPIHKYSLGENLLQSLGQKNSVMALKDKYLAEDGEIYAKFKSQLDGLCQRYTVDRQRLSKVRDYIGKLDSLQELLMSEWEDDSPKELSPEAHSEEDMAYMFYSLHYGASALFESLPDRENAIQYIDREPDSKDNSLRFGLVTWGFNHSGGHHSNSGPNDDLVNYLRDIGLTVGSFPGVWENPGYPSISLNNKPPAVATAKDISDSAIKFILNIDDIKDFPDVMAARNEIYQKLLKVPGMAQRIQSKKST